MTQIIDAYLGLAALRQAGYRSTATAVAELVDNAIEANSKYIEIIAIEREVILEHRSSTQVNQIAVLDNGCGMDLCTLQNCLSMGWGTRLETRDGLGRFGFGLKGASISQARKVEVYSWQSEGEIWKATLDLDKIQNEKQQTLEPIEKSEIPSVFTKFFHEKIGKSGSLIVWDKLDQIDLKRPSTLISRINKELCRIYRHFLDSDERYGGQHFISLHVINPDADQVVKTVQLSANDPLYILTPNNLPGYHNQSTNELIEDFSLNIKYIQHGEEKESPIEIRCSVARPEIQALGGNSPVGKHYGDNSGISFVRAGREIDFGSFGFVGSSEPRHRWWGIEIRFKPELDELFGVTNNKQEVRGFKKLEPENEQYLEDSIFLDNKAILQLELNKIVDENIKKMMKIITGRKEGVKGEKGKAEGVIASINQELCNDSSPTQSADHAKSTTDIDKLNERVELLLEDDTSLSHEEAEVIAKSTINYCVDLKTANWPGTLFLDRRPVANASVGVINRNTKFYEVFMRHLEQADDQKGMEALRVIITSLIRAEDELCKQFDPKVFTRFRERWGTLVDQLLEHAGT